MTSSRLKASTVHLASTCSMADSRPSLTMRSAGTPAARRRLASASAAVAVAVDEGRDQSLHGSIGRSPSVPGSITVADGTGSRQAFRARTWRQEGLLAGDPCRPHRRRRGGRALWRGGPPRHAAARLPTAARADHAGRVAPARRTARGRGAALQAPPRPVTYPRRLASLGPDGQRWGAAPRSVIRRRRRAEVAPVRGV